LNEAAETKAQGRGVSGNKRGPPWVHDVPSGDSGTDRHGGGKRYAWQCLNRVKVGRKKRPHKKKKRWCREGTRPELLRLTKCAKSFPDRKGGDCPMLKVEVRRKVGREKGGGHVT